MMRKAEPERFDPSVIAYVTGKSYPHVEGWFAGYEGGASLMDVVKFLERSNCPDIDAKSAKRLRILLEACGYGAGSDEGPEKAEDPEADKAINFIVNMVSANPGINEDTLSRFARLAQIECFDRALKKLVEEGRLYRTCEWSHPEMVSYRLKEDCLSACDSEE